MADNPVHLTLPARLIWNWKPGEFFIFSERTLHRSSVNTSDKRRLGISIRVTLPIVHVFQDSAPLHRGHTAILAQRERTSWASTVTRAARNDSHWSMCRGDQLIVRRAKIDVGGPVGRPPHHGVCRRDPWIALRIMAYVGETL